MFSSEQEVDDRTLALTPITVKSWTRMTVSASYPLMGVSIIREKMWSVV
jgi:hypothetical protein